eukprot:Platyproteum_vivax@DN48_c0_g1_i1.p1
MSMTSLLATVAAALAGAAVGEGPIQALLKKHIPFLLSKAPGLGLPRLYSIVLLTNVVDTTMVVTYLGMKVASARKELQERAQAKGDTDAAARFSYPKLYAEGFSPEAQEFNCIQRGHQHALESLPSFLMCSLVAGFHYPVCTAIAGLLWCEGRLFFANDYKKGADKRYNSFGMLIWSSYFFVVGAAAMSGIKMLTYCKK